MRSPLPLALAPGVVVAALGRRGAVAGAVACVLLVGIILGRTGLWFAGPGSPGGQHGTDGEHGRVHAPGSAASAITSGARLRVPAIGVDAAVESVGRDAGGRMAVPSRPEDVGWYSYGSAPGDPGDAVIDGHLDWGNRPAVFWKLGQLKRGDEIIVEMPSRDAAHFQVDTLTRVPYTARPPGLFTTSGPSRLSLITCGGSYDHLERTYSQRLIVDAHLLT